MKLKTIENTNIKYIEIVGKGENISDETKRIYFSKSGNQIIKNIDNIDNEKLNQLELYVSKKGVYVLTKKTNKNIITFNDNIESSFRGTSWIEEIDNGIVISATGNGRIGEHTEFIASLKENGYLIVGFNGRYSAGYVIYQNKNGKLIKNVFSNNGKYVNMFVLEKAKTLAGLNDICEITGPIDCENTEEKEKIIEEFKNSLNNTDIEIKKVDEKYQLKINDFILTIDNIEKIQNKNK